jgi:hypothetical protein
MDALYSLFLRHECQEVEQGTGHCPVAATCEQGGKDDIVSDATTVGRVQTLTLEGLQRSRQLPNPGRPLNTGGALEEKQ